MNKNHFHFARVSVEHSQLTEVITPSIGNPTPAKIQSVIKSYRNDEEFLWGCFLNEILVGVVGFSVRAPLAVIRHLSVRAKFRRHGIGRSLIEQVITTFLVEKLETETDADSVDFYTSVGFSCLEKPGHFGKRFICEFVVTK